RRPPSSTPFPYTTLFRSISPTAEIPSGSSKGSGTGGVIPGGFGGHQDPLHPLFKAGSGEEHAVTTSGALHPDVHAHPDHLPSIGAAGMRLFHLHNVTQTKDLSLHR